MNFTFINSTVRSSLCINIFSQRLNIKCPHNSLSGSRIVGEAFLKSLGILIHDGEQNLLENIITCHSCLVSH